MEESIRELAENLEPSKRDLSYTFLWFTVSTSLALSGYFIKQVFDWYGRKLMWASIRQTFVLYVNELKSELEIHKGFAEVVKEDLQKMENGVPCKFDSWQYVLPVASNMFSLINSERVLHAFERKFSRLWGVISIRRKRDVLERSFFDTIGALHHSPSLFNRLLKAQTEIIGDLNKTDKEITQISKEFNQALLDLLNSNEIPKNKELTNQFNAFLDKLKKRQAFVISEREKERIIPIYTGDFVAELKEQISTSDHIETGLYGIFWSYLSDLEYKFSQWENRKANGVIEIDNLLKETKDFIQCCVDFDESYS